MRPIAVAEEEPRAGDRTLAARATLAATRLFVVLTAWFGFASAVFLNVEWVSHRMAAAFACAAVLTGLLLTGSLRGAFVTAANRIWQSFAVAHPIRTAAIIVVAGAIVRVMWVWVVPPVQLSDMAAYFDLATSLSQRGEYVLGDTVAFWPPGLPLTLVPTIRVLGAQPWVPVVNNLVWFVATSALLFALVRRIAGSTWAVFAVAVIAVWPNWILLSGLASKELLLATLLTAALWLRVSRDATLSQALLCGLLTGAMTLTQPSAMFVPAVFLITDIAAQLRMSQIVARASVLLAGMCIVVAPWTYRNYIALHEFVPVSNNGGVTMWVGNNPQATGQFVEVPARFHRLPEVERDRAARREALDWIAANPGRFLTLAVRKQALFWGDDAKGAYESMKRPGTERDRSYAIAKAVSNAFWVLVLGALAVASLVLWRTPATAAWLTPIVLLIAYFQSFQVVFESDGRFHTPLMPLFVVVIVGGLAAAARARGAARRED
jgi:4-amino-4-deoxy-L-arabinose transferase-like glycosyltransferase